MPQSKAATCWGCRHPEGEGACTSRCYSSPSRPGCAVLCCFIDTARPRTVGGASCGSSLTLTSDCGMGACAEVGGGASSQVTTAQVTVYANRCVTGVNRSPIIATVSACDTEGSEHVDSRRRALRSEYCVHTHACMTGGCNTPPSWIGALGANMSMSRRQQPRVGPTNWFLKACGGRPDQIHRLGKLASQHVFGAPSRLDLLAPLHEPSGGVLCKPAAWQRSQYSGRVPCIAREAVPVHRLYQYTQPALPWHTQQPPGPA